ncbi:uncharacterized protein LOC107854329 [Capsicum annuum]|uniref:uncharacterized protein LOC107854329 n=1 Tax=Capsicum annuum TaxID=4072 RepID=UPI001FB16416|nr:uncharacterized protein LOC107854329 [Capsicum annuum]
MELSKSDECVKMLEINLKNHCGGREAITIGRDLTSRELHLHVHTYNHDDKSFVSNHSRLLHKKYEEIIQKKRLTESEIDQLESYYQAAGGVKKKRLYGLGSEAEGDFGKKLCDRNASTSSVPPSVSLSTKNLKEFEKQLIMALTTHFLR